MGEGKGGGPPTGGWAPPPDGVVPPGFQPVGDGSAVGTTFTNDLTGQQIHWGGTQWVNDASGGPFTHAYDPESGQTAFQNPKTGAWEVHLPPANFVVDDDVPPDHLGYTFVNLNGQHIHYSWAQGAWIDNATNAPVPVGTTEKPNTGDEAGRVEVPEPDPSAVPYQDSPQDVLAKNSIASSRLKALQLGDDSVPHGTIAKDYAADLKNLEHSLALREQLIAAGAPSIQIAIVEGHIADLQKYIKAWTVRPGPNKDKPGSAPFPGGANSVNDLAQMDDLTGEIQMAGKIFETGLDAAGVEVGGHLGKFIGGQGIGGGGSQVVVPKHKTAKGYLGKPSGAASSTPGGGQVVPQQGDTLPLTVDPPPGGQAKTQTLIGQEPTAKPGTAKGETQVISGGKTEVGRPTVGQLNDAQAAAVARQSAADKAAQKSGFKDFAEMEVKINEKKQRDYALKNPRDVELLQPKPGETKQQTAARYGRETSLGNTKWDPQDAATNMATSRRELEQLTTGTSPTLKPTEKNLKILVDNHAAAVQTVRDGESKIPDYWNRMTPDTKQMLLEELKASQGKDYNYWKARLDQQGVGTAPPPYQETRVEPPTLGPPIGVATPPRKVAVGGIVAVLMVGVVAVAGVVVLSGPGSTTSPGATSAGPGSTPGTSSVAVVPGESPACRTASVLQRVIQAATQLALADACSRQMKDGTDDRVEYDGTPSTVKPAVGDIVAVGDPVVELTAADADAVAAACVFPPDPASPPPLGPPRAYPAAIYCSKTAPNAGSYEMYSMEFATPIAADSDGNWEAGLGFQRGTGTTWASSVGDPLNGHNAFYTVRFGLQGVFGPYFATWDGEQGTFFVEHASDVFAVLDGEILLVFVPSAEWADVDSCRWFTYYGRTDNSGGAVDLWPEAAEQAATC